MNQLFLLIWFLLCIPGIIVVARGKPLIWEDAKDRPASYWRKQGAWLIMFMVVLFGVPWLIHYQLG